MRKSLYSAGLTIAFAIMIVGCTNDAAKEAGPSTSLTLNRINIETGDITKVSCDVELTDKDVVSTRNPNAILKANFHTINGHHVVINGAETPSGPHGSGHITGPIYIDVQFDVTCVTQFGNKAIVGGLATAVDFGDNPEGLVLVPGDNLYLLVEDNGEGAKNPRDRYNGEVLFGTQPALPLPITACDGLYLIQEVFQVYTFWPDEEWHDVAQKNDFVVIK